MSSVATSQAENIKPRKLLMVFPGTAGSSSNLLYSRFKAVLHICSNLLIYNTYICLKHFLAKVPRGTFHDTRGVQGASWRVISINNIILLYIQATPSAGRDAIPGQTLCRKGSENAENAVLVGLEHPLTSTRTGYLLTL